jgi:hypothetical protein
MNRRQRAGVAALAIAPTTVAGVFLIRCQCVAAAWTIELMAAVIFSVWVFSKD